MNTTQLETLTVIVDIQDDLPVRSGYEGVFEEEQKSLTIIVNYYSQWHLTTVEYLGVL